MIWYEGEGDNNHPLLAEFSYKYKGDGDRHDGAMAGLAYDVFMQLQNLDWIDPESNTKTAYVYDLVDC